MVELSGDGRVELVRRPREAYRAVGSFEIDSIGGRVQISEGTAQVEDLVWEVTEPARIDWDAASLSVDRLRMRREGVDPMQLVASGTLHS